MYSHKVLALKIHKLVNACVHINAQIVEKGISTCWRLKLYNTDVRCSYTLRTFRIGDTGGILTMFKTIFQQGEANLVNMYLVY